MMYNCVRNESILVNKVNEFVSLFVFGTFLYNTKILLVGNQKYILNQIKLSVTKSLLHSSYDLFWTIIVNTHQ